MTFLRLRLLSKPGLWLILSLHTGDDWSLLLRVGLVLVDVVLVVIVTVQQRVPEQVAEQVRDLGPANTRLVLEAARAEGIPRRS